MIVGLGLDVVQISRFKKEVDRSGSEFLSEVLRPAEAAACGRRRNPLPCCAARFAAKEALFKALGTGRIGAMTWHDVEVVTDSGGAPRLELHDEAARVAAGRGVRSIHLSLTHEVEYAAAVVLLEG